MEKIKFNLLENGWIPCSMLNNEFKLLSIKEALFKADQILDISSNNPLAPISIYRLLLAILHRNFGPKDRKEWVSIFKRGMWDKNILETYFNVWTQKFELFNKAGDRFYQTEIPEISNKTPITKLNHALSSGNNAALFDHNWDSDITPISVEEVAQLLVTFQCFAVGGGKSVPFYFSHAPLISSICVMLKGRNLFETLMLNFIRYDNDHPFVQSNKREDIPFWERTDKKLNKNKDGRYPNGYLDYLTWQSRRIWLIHEIQNGKITVKEVYMAQGEKVIDEWAEDPQMVYKLDEKNKKIPIKLNPDRHVWRDVEALLRLNDSGSKFVSPIAINWISMLMQMDVLSAASRYNLEVFGLCNDPKKAARILSWNRSSIPLPLKFLEDQSLVENIKAFIQKCEKIENILNKTLYFFGKDYLFPESQTLSTNQRNKVKEFVGNYQISTRYWNRIEQYFYAFMKKIALYSGFDKRMEILKEYINNNIIKTARDLFSIINKNFREDLRALKPLIQNKGFFMKQLQDIKQN